MGLHAADESGGLRALRPLLVVGRRERRTSSRGSSTARSAPSSRPTPQGATGTSYGTGAPDLSRAGVPEHRADRDCPGHRSSRRNEGRRAHEEAAPCVESEGLTTVQPWCHTGDHNLAMRLELRNSRSSRGHGRVSTGLPFRSVRVPVVRRSVRNTPHSAQASRQRRSPGGVAGFGSWPMRSGRLRGSAHCNAARAVSRLYLLFWYFVF